MCNLHGGNNDERRQHIGQQVFEQDARRRQRKAGRSLDVFLVAFDQRSTPYGARVVRPLHGDQCNHDLVDALAEGRQQHQRDEDGRERQLQVDDPHDDCFDPAAEPGGDEPDRETDGERAHRGQRAYAEADAQAVENRRQHVAPLVVAAQPERHAVQALAARRQLRIHDVERRQVVRVLRRHQRRADGHDEDQDQGCEPDQRQAAFREIRGDALERRFDACAAHALASARRTRGSSIEYRRSTSRLMTTNRQTMIST